MDFFFARESAETFHASTPIPGSSATFSQTPCFLPSLNWRALRKAFSLLKTSRTSGRITTLLCSPGRKTSAAPGPASQIVTANVSDGCGDFTCSVAQAYFGRAVCRCFRFSFPKKISPLRAESATRDKPCRHRARQFSSGARSSDFSSLWRKESLACVRISYFGSGLKTSDIDVTAVWRERAGNKALFSGHGYSIRQIALRVFPCSDCLRYADVVRIRRRWGRSRTWRSLTV